MPNVRQKLLVKNIQEKIKNAQKVSMSQSMKEVGYSEHYAHNPSQITATKSWSKMLQESISDTNLLEAHKSQLQARKIEIIKFPSDLTPTKIRVLAESIDCEVMGMTKKEEYFEVVLAIPDQMTRSRALDKAYKIKGRYSPEPETMERPYQDLSDEELDTLIAQGSKIYSK